MTKKVQKIKANLEEKPTQAPVDGGSELEQVLTVLGVAGVDASKSKLGRLASVLINDALESVHREYPNLHPGAAAEIVGGNLEKVDLREKLMKIVEVFFEAQQEMLREIVDGKIIESWEKKEQQEDSTSEEPIEDPADESDFVEDTPPV